MGAKHRFLIAAAAWTVVPLASANAQEAEAPAAATQNDDGDIVVTATRGNQTLQKTAVAISAVSAETIEARGITNLTGLTNVVPAAKINYSLGAVQLNVRGVGSEIDLPYVPEPAGINFNDVYIPRLATNTTVMDIEQIEILPGPQGTLYGKGALGGVANIRSAMPKNERSFKITGEAGNYELLKLTAIANLPLADNLAIRIAGSTTHRGAYFSNGNDTDEAKTVRLSLLWNPSDEFEVYLWGQYYHNRMKPQATSYLKPFLNDDPYDQPQFDPGVVAAGLFPAPGSDVSQTTLFLRGIVTGARFTYDLGDLKIQYIPSYIHYLDDDLRFLQGLSTVSDGTIDQTTHELRFSGDLTDRLSWIGSLYYYHNKSDIDSTLSASFGQVAGNRLLHRNEGVAGFAQLQYELLDTLRVTAGGRYSEDKMSARPGSLVHTPGGDIPFSVAAKWNHFDWKVGVEADIGPQSMAYANVQTAYSPGGYRASAVFAGLRLEEQTMIGYTVGIKNRFFDNRLLFNVEGYYYDYKNYTISTLANGAFDNFGIPKTRIYGAQVDLAYSFDTKTKITLNANFLSAKIRELVLDGVDFSGNSLPNSPKAAVSLGFEHGVDLSNGGDLTFRADTHYESGYWKVYSNAFNFRQNEFAKLDLSLTYTAPSDNWDLTAYVLNATDKATLAAGAHSGYPSPYENYGYIDPPRTYGLRLNVKFD